MLLDLMSPYSSQSFNIKLANLFGLNTAVYWNQLLDIYSRVINKKYTEIVQNDGYFDLDRDYITKRTTLELEDQLLCDKVLLRAEIIDYDQANTNRLRIDLDKMREILVQDDPDVLKKIQMKSRIKQADAALAKRLGMASAFKNMIVEQDPDLLRSYYNWIDTIVLDKKDFLNRTIVETFVKTIRSYSDSKEVQLGIIEQAIIQGYKNAAFAWDLYSKHHKNTGTRIGTTQKTGIGIDPNSTF